MALLLLGILIWWGAHFFRRFAPDARASLGRRGKGLIALALVASVVLMIIGYRSADSFDLALPPPYFTHINNTLMLFALYFTSPGPAKGALFYKLRHPMLLGFAMWAVAHLLVNWDPASFVLFGSMLVWALAEMVVINRAEPDWTPNPKGRIAKDGIFFAASTVLLGVIGFVHGLVGPSPFPG
ncbi:NnrU family protein [Phaeobacter sp. C3_T13_0]|uniref:NnrU family protein n=1 Tax=Phaeobacter cretensis TaxID=3342641 RepID=UPI0039BD53A8